MDQRLPFEAQRECVRRDSNKQRALRRLQEGPATTVELIAVAGTRAPARAHELIKEGWPIVVESKGGGLFVYRLTGER